MTVLDLIVLGWTRQCWAGLGWAVLDYITLLNVIRHLNLTVIPPNSLCLALKHVQSYLMSNRQDIELHLFLLAKPTPHQTICKISQMKWNRFDLSSFLELILETQYW